MPRFPLLPLALLTALSVASAEVGGTLKGTLAAPEFAGYRLSGNVLTGPGGVVVTFSARTGASGTSYVQGATVSLPTLDPLLAGKLLSGLTGQDIAQPLADYLNRPEVRLRLVPGFTASADPYDVALKSVGTGGLSMGGQSMGGLSMNVVLHQQTGFAPVPLNRIQGNPAATHVVRMYSDFQCPYCQKAELEALPDVLKTLPKDVRFEFHHVPLVKIHPNARPAAEASVCAANQGKFFAFKDALFHRNDWQRAANPGPVFAQAAAASGINSQLFQSCVSTRTGQAEVEAGLAEAERIGIQGTPTVYIDGYQVADPYDAASYQALLDFVRAKVSGH